jgi:hypothetical protein
MGSSLARKRALSLNITNADNGGSSSSPSPRRSSEAGTLFKPPETSPRRSSIVAVNERQSRLEGVRNKRAHRTSKHIDRFLKINVAISSTSGDSFDVTVDKTQTIEHLAHHIEAQYAFRREQNESKTSLEPLEIGQVYNSGMLALKFHEVIGDVLEQNDTVNVINTYHGTTVRITFHI